MRIKQILALIMALALILSLAACGRTESTATAVESTTNSAAEEPAASTAESVVEADPQPGEETEGESGMEELVVEEPIPPIELPLTDEPTTFSLYYSQPGFFNQFLEDPSMNECVKKLAELTNVTLDFYVVPAETESEQFLIMAAGGTLPDLVMNGSNLYAGGGAKAIEDGVLVDLMEYEDLMPNYFSYVNRDSEWRTIFTVNDGESVDGVYQIDYPIAGGTEGLVLRGDWIEELNLEMPETYDDYHEILSAFKSEKNCSAPLLISALGDNGVWARGFGCNAAISDHNDQQLMFGEVDGNIIFWPTSEGYKNMLELLATWYSEGLIDKDWYTKTSTSAQADETLISAEQSGVWFSNRMSLQTYETCFTNEKADVVASRIPTVDGSYKNAFQEAPTLKDHTCLNISTNCPDPELAARYLDYFYSEDGVTMVNFGMQGITFEYDEQGAPQFTDYIMNSDTGLGGELAFVLFGMGSFPSVKDTTNFYTDIIRAAVDVWSLASNDESKYHGLSQAIQLTADESTEVKSIMTDIVTYVRETTFKIICGDVTIEAFDDMVAHAETLGIADAIAIYQEKYDAYNS